MQKAEEDLNFTSGLISDRVRTIALGILAFVWLFVIADPQKDSVLLKLSPSPSLLVAIALLAIFTILFDYLQYVAGYLGTKRAYNKAHDKAGNTMNVAVDYDDAGCWYCLRTFFFVAKQIILVIASSLLVYALIKAWLGFHQSVLPVLPTQ